MDLVDEDRIIEGLSRLLHRLLDRIEIEVIDGKCLRFTIEIVDKPPKESAGQ